MVEVHEEEEEEDSVTFALAPSDSSNLQLSGFTVGESSSTSFPILSFSAAVFYACSTVSCTSVDANLHLIVLANLYSVE